MPSQVGLGRHQRGALREREDEDEVEEQLERCDPLFLASGRRHPTVLAGRLHGAILARRSRECRTPVRPRGEGASWRTRSSRARTSRPRRAGAIDVVVMHTMEIARAAGRGGDLRTLVPSAGLDGSRRTTASTRDTVIQCVREKDIAWHARGGNTTLDRRRARRLRATDDERTGPTRTRGASSRGPRRSSPTCAGAGGSRCAGSSRTTSSRVGTASPGTSR